MALWSNTDEASSAPKHTVNTTNGATGVEAFEQTPVGTWGVDTTEARAKNINGHAGWILRTVGSGGREGRIIEETLVAMGSMSSDSEDVVYPDAILNITSQPTNASVVANTGGSNTASFTFGVTSTPDATITYQWQYDNSGTWVNVTNGTPANTTYTGATTATLVVIPTDVDANTAKYRAVASSSGATSVTSANVVLTVL
jgi:hypothetical protein